MGSHSTQASPSRSGSAFVQPTPIGNAQKSLSQERDRWFESGSLQRRIRCELDLGEGGFAGEIAAAPPCSRSRRFWGTPVDPLFAAPPLGSDSRAIVDEIGWGDSFSQLVADGIVAEKLPAGTPPGRQRPAEGMAAR